MSGNTDIYGWLDEGGILIYSNPSYGFFTLVVNDTHIESVRLVDFAGKVMMHRNWTGNREQSFILDHVPAGVYFVQVYTDDKVIVRKIIIL